MLDEKEAWWDADAGHCMAAGLIKPSRGWLFLLQKPNSALTSVYILAIKMPTARQ